MSGLRLRATLSCRLTAALLGLAALSMAGFRYAQTSSELVAKRHADDPRPQRGFRDDELVGAGEGAGMRIAQVFSERIHDPGVLRDTERGVEGRVRGILEPQPPRRDAGHIDRWIRAGLGK